MLYSTRPYRAHLAAQCISLETALVECRQPGMPELCLDRTGRRPSKAQIGIENLKKLFRRGPFPGAKTNKKGAGGGAPTGAPRASPRRSRQTAPVLRPTPTRESTAPGGTRDVAGGRGGDFEAVRGAAHPARCGGVGPKLSFKPGEVGGLRGLSCVGRHEMGSRHEGLKAVLRGAMWELPF